MEWLALVTLLSASQVVVGLLNSTAIIVNPDGFTIYPCLQVDHRESDLDSSMMGSWFVMEVIQHQEYKKQREYGICPRLNMYLMDTTFVKLVWQERSGDVNYRFKMVDPENRGFWMAWGKQSGTILNKVYEQFSGSVQVLEAAPERMVMTFCSSQPPTSQPGPDIRRHYSIVLVRNATAPYDIQGTHNILSKYSLPEVSTELICKNGPGSDATKFLPSLTVIIPTIFVLLSGAN